MFMGMHYRYTLYTIATGLAASNYGLALQNAPLSVSAGYHVIYSYSGTAVPSSLKTYITQGKVGGVILFGSNVNSSTPNAIADLQSTWQQSRYYTGSPLLIVTDQEGGEVVRLPGGPNESEKEIGSSSNPTTAATTAGQQAADALATYNNNGNLAPVCDVFRTPGDFDDQYQRSYSSDPNIAAECSSAFVTAQQGSGAVTALKHFPGLGAATANENTDERPVTLNVSIDDLRAIDEVPFTAGIQAGTKMVMPSWALYPDFDAYYPSGLSSSWIKDELRGRLGFTGVTISDSIEAGALEVFGDDYGHRAVLATAAGMDLILAAIQDPEQGSDIVDALVDAVDNGTLDASNFSDSSQRILDLRSGL